MSELERLSDAELLSTIGQAQAILNRRERERGRKYQEFMAALERANNPSVSERERLKEVVNRRFGPSHPRPCNNPDVTGCALWRCQFANECQDPRPLAQPDRLHETATGGETA